MGTKINYQHFTRSKLMPQKPEQHTRIDTRQFTRQLDVLNEAKQYWDLLADFRRDRKRNVKYAYGDQWSDRVKDPDTGRYITEKALIEKEGNIPMTQNMIRPLLKNIAGQFRNNQKEPVCTARNREEQELGEMMSIAIQALYQLNDLWELDAAQFNEYNLSSVSCQRIEYAYNDAKQQRDVWVYNVNPNRLFFNPVEDVRAWDLSLIGEIMDIKLIDLISTFARNQEEAYKLIDLYKQNDIRTLTNFARTVLNNPADAPLDFFFPAQSHLCRVILIWRKECKEQLFIHDTLKGSTYWAEIDDKTKIDAINAERISEAAQYGISSENVPILEYEWRTHNYWYYRYLTPSGEVIAEGESPFWHNEHNYCIRVFPLVDGLIHSPVKDLIDLQRNMNRMILINDMIITSSAKGVWLVNEEALGEMSKEDIIDEVQRANGVIFVKLKPGIDINSVARQYSHNATNIGTYEAMTMWKNMMDDISGVHSAMQGKTPSAGTPASLYAQQTQNASINLVEILDSFNSYRQNRDMKLLRTLQQFWNEKKVINITGNYYSDKAKVYDPAKVRNVEFDLTISESVSSPVYRMMINDTLMQLFEKGAISIKALLSNCALPFADKILQTIEQEQQEMQQEQMLLQQMQQQVTQQQM